MLVQYVIPMIWQNHVFPIDRVHFHMPFYPCLELGISTHPVEKEYKYGHQPLKTLILDW
jgi:hypothetical protein